MKKTRVIFFFIVLLVFSPLFCEGMPEYSTLQKKTQSTQESQSVDQISTDMSSLTSLYRYVDAIYYKDVDKSAVKEAMTEAMLEALGDKYSFYVPASEAENYSEESTGKYGGIGVYLVKQNPQNSDPNNPDTYMITIESPFRGAPAERAGLRSGDMIGAIDGEKVNSLTSTEASKKLRGTPGSSVTLTVYRGNTSFDVTLTRELINTPVIESTMLDDGIGYISISSYTSDTSSQLLDALHDLKAKGLKSLIIDERNNGGGEVDTAMKCANAFLPQGSVIVTMEGRKGTNTKQRYTASGNQQVSSDMPIVLLVNGGSASSSEIFAAALHDNKRATLIGTKTFGKGIFQSVFTYGDGYIQLTTGRYFTPNGECIHEKGIEPDITVEDFIVPDTQIEAYSTLIKDDATGKFIKDNPDFTEANMQKFVGQEKETGIDATILKILIRNAYYNKTMKYEDIPIVDTEYDPPLMRAIKYLKTGS
ncbi:MAG: S41 family peptidase [Sphaerochaetaceae bacterium]|jgi:carboxyl-terminal processing protease